MEFSINIPPFIPDNRGNKQERYRILDHNGEADALLLLCGPDEVADQVREFAGRAFKNVRLGEKSSKKWTHGFFFPDGVPQDVADLCENLTEWLSIPTSPSLDISLSLDWYKQPNDDGELVHTPAGTLIYRTKYATEPTWSSSRQARRDLLTAMSGVIGTHPLFAQAAVISSPPGSKGDGQSFGEKLGPDVATKTGLPFVAMHGPARPPQKEEIVRDVRDDFELSEVVRDPIILIDDVFHTGVTLESAARAARRAGATAVLALTAARTLRK
ncbi:phosphoribosyltransferase [Kocuria sp. KD4]|uniref:phosphoribosyltransferase n=1 Tax=Kocuria sp. KD4 TaxID=2719588 RepID=UPI00142780A3|nr:phosphoribosyltransferase [Kocuria sp. KD4]QIR70709.1 phosphoribosyltransferase [Kocuria sp. KD4]